MTRLEGKFNDSIDLTKVTVPVGQEWFWVDVLQASGLFTHVEREDYFCPESVDTIIGIGHPDINLPKPAKVTRAGDLQDVVAFPKAQYPKPTEVNDFFGNLENVFISLRAWGRCSFGGNVRLTPDTTGASLNVTFVDSEASSNSNIGVLALSNPGTAATAVMLRNSRCQQQRYRT